MVAETESRASSLFTHAAGVTTVRPMTNATRYLSAGAYLNEPFASAVIKELVDEDHRAVVPSYGFDVGPVITHCLRARRLRLTRDLLLAGVLFLAFLLSPIAGFLYLAAGVLMFVLLALAPGRVRRRTVVLVLVIWVTVSLGLYLLSLLVALLSGATSVESPYESSGPVSLWANPLVAVFVTMLLGGAVLVIAFGYRVKVYRILSRELRRGTPPPAPPTGSERIQRQIADVSSAQRGNVTLYSAENPFLGSGDVTSPWSRAWSIVLELDRPASRPLLGDVQGPKPVDPVSLHRHVRRHLMAMAEEYPLKEDDEPVKDDRRRLPPNERIAGLNIDYHVVARGECAQYPREAEPGPGAPSYQGHPLIDAQNSVPYSKASPEAIEAIIRHPQGSVRCYQRVTVGAHGQAIKDSGDRVIAPAEDQDIALSTFFYVAVEGRMLYGQFVANVLPPVQRQFRIVDVLPSLPRGSVARKAIVDSWLPALVDALLGPLRAPQRIFQRVRSEMRTDVLKPADYSVYDYGARVSVRELGAEKDLATFMQELDADKYTRLIERRLDEAVLDYLENECGVNTDAYRQQASMVLNNGVIMTGGTVSGQVAGGAGAQVTQKKTSAR